MTTRKAAKEGNVLAPLPPKQFRFICWAALAFGVAVTLASAWRWWTFHYGTFDVAFYTQALWLALRGEFHVSLLDTSLMGNHAEPVVFLILPFFALWPNPVVFVVIQSIALASLPLAGWRIARAFRLSETPSAMLALLLLVMPATGFMAIHEFHPEALSAPLLLWMLDARIRKQYRRFVLFLLLTISCKENIAMIAAWMSLGCLILERKNGWVWNVRWNVIPGLLSGGWFLFYALYLSPKLNAGRVDYSGLYRHLSSFEEWTQHPLEAAGKTLSHLIGAGVEGNMLWIMLLSVAALPLVRMRWLFFCIPILLQHLLSWRRSEWMIYFHYAAPLVPLFWMAAAEWCRDRTARLTNWIAGTCLAASLALQVVVGPAREIPSLFENLPETFVRRDAAQGLLDKVSETESVTASLGFLSHLACRSELRSLHIVLKGLNVLGGEPISYAEATDVILVDYEDVATFHTAVGFYHPTMRTVNGDIIPSSDRLLHTYVGDSDWTSESVNSVTLLRRIPKAEMISPHASGTEIPGTGLVLRGVEATPLEKGTRLMFDWHATGSRDSFPWLTIVLESGSFRYSFERGLCVPWLTEGRRGQEMVDVIVPPSVPSGEYKLFGTFHDRSHLGWSAAKPPVFVSAEWGTLRVERTGEEEAAQLD
jgi:uncharacterized membrane protein